MANGAELGRGVVSLLPKYLSIGACLDMERVPSDIQPFLLEATLNHHDESGPDNRRFFDGFEGA